MAGNPYTDLHRPPLHAGALNSALTGPPAVWREIVVVPTTGSTNADVAAAARAGAAEGLVVIAEHQSTGRGRLDRHWEAPARSSIMLSVLLRPAAPIARWGWLPLLAGVALAEAVARVGVVDAGLKWPNDLLVRPGVATGTRAYGKCAGILAEAVDGAVVVGMGLNVSQSAAELPPGGAFAPTSLELADSASTDRDPLVRAVLRGLSDRYLAWNEAGGDPDVSGVRDAYRALCLTVGEVVSVSVPGGATVRGTATDIDADGRLVVDDGTAIRALAAGDVEHVR